MKERPILMSGAMVRATLNGSKAQTRRIVKPQLGDDAGTHNHGLGLDEILHLCPHGQPGDQLWVRESFGFVDGIPQFKAGGGGHPVITPAKWTPSIHMPRAASRIQLHIETVRVQRIQEITQRDALAEGIWRGQGGEYWSGIQGFIGHETAISAFIELWDAINAKRGFGWDKNPWVWALTFKMIAPKCHACGKYPAPHGKLCDGCEAYREHQA